MIAMRDYLNEGGKLVVGGRNAHAWPIGTGGLTATGPYQGRRTRCSASSIPTTTRGDDDLPGTAFQRYRGISNDTWQNYLGAVAARGTAPRRATATRRSTPRR